jgi:hypothetical protein
VKSEIVVGIVELNFHSSLVAIHSSFSPRSVVDARDPAKVEDQVRFLTGTSEVSNGLMSFVATGWFSSVQT